MTSSPAFGAIVLLALSTSPCSAQGQVPPVHADDTTAVATTGSAVSGSHLPRGKPRTAAPAKEDRQPPRLRRWSVTVGIGGNSKGPAVDLEAAMRAAGFGDRSFGGFFQTNYNDVIWHPFSNTGFGAIGFARSIDVEYRFREHLGLGVVYSHSPIGTTIGYHEPMQYLFVNTDVDSAGLTGTLVYRGLRAAIGPAWHVARTRQDEGGQTTRRQSHGQLGFVGRLGVQTPARSRVYLDARAQYNHVGRSTVGPFVSHAFFSQPERVVQASAVDFNNWLFTVGIGFRF